MQSPAVLITSHYPLATTFQLTSSARCPWTAALGDHFLHARYAFAGLGRTLCHLLDVDQKVWIIHLPAHCRNELLVLGVNEIKFAAEVVEQTGVHGAAIDQRRCLFPVRKRHADVGLLGLS